jgi:hypothetical protein
MNALVNADPAALAILGGSLCLLTLILGVLWIAGAIVRADDRTHLPACLRALGDLVQAFRR